MAEFSSAFSAAFDVADGSATVHLDISLRHNDLTLQHNDQTLHHNDATVLGHKD